MWHFIAKILLVPVVFINSLFVFNVPDPVPAVSIIPTIEATVSVSPTKKPTITTTPKRVYITPTITQTPASTPISLAPETWSSLESKYFAEANQKGWPSLIITNVNGEKRYYRKEGSSWVQKSTLAEANQSYVVPTTLPLPPTIDQLKHFFAFCAQSVAMQEYCDTKKALDQYYSSQNFRNAMDMYIAKDEATSATQQKNNTQTYVPPYMPSYNYPAPPVYIPPLIPFPSTIPTYSPPTPVPNTFQQNDYQKKLCDSVGGIYLFGTCSIPIHG